MRRSRLVVAAVALSVVGGGLFVGSASALTGNDSACRGLVSSTTSPTHRDLLTYQACRFDRLDASVKALGATTPTPIATPSPTPSPSPTPTTSSPTPTPTPTPTATPGAFPDATNTGPTGTLTAYTGPATITTAGTVIDGKKITACIVVKANNVTIKNSLIQSDGCFFNVLSDNGNTGLKLTDVEIDGQGNSTGDSAVNGSGYTCLRCDVHGTVDGFKAGSDVVIQDSWVHDLVIGNGSHNDGIQSLGTTSLKVLHNRIVMADGATSAVILSTGSADDMRNVQIANNLLGGGAYTVYGGYEAGRDDLSKVSNIAVTDNQFTTVVFPKSGAYGPLTSVDSPVVTARNIYADGPNAGKPV